MSGTVYASASDVIARGRKLTDEECQIAETLLSSASAQLRVTARRYGKNIDVMIADEETGEDFASVVKDTVVQAVVRALDSVSDDRSMISQGSETNGSYSISMTYLNAGQSLYFLKSELRDLGLLNQTYGALDIYGGNNVY